MLPSVARCVAQASARFSGAFSACSSHEGCDFFSLRVQRILRLLSFRFRCVTAFLVTRSSGLETGGRALAIRLPVGTQLLDRVAAELLDRGVGQHDRDHRFADDRRGGTAQTSLRSIVAGLSVIVARSTDRSGFISVEIGFM